MSSLRTTLSSGEVFIVARIASFSLLIYSLLLNSNSVVKNEKADRCVLKSHLSFSVIAKLRVVMAKRSAVEQIVIEEKTVGEAIAKLIAAREKGESYNSNIMSMQRLIENASLKTFYLYVSDM